MNIGDIILVGERKYVIHHKIGDVPYLMDLETRIVAAAWFDLAPESLFMSKPDNVEWLDIKRFNKKYSFMTTGDYA